MQRSLLTGGLAAVALAVAPGLAGASVVDVPDRPYVLVPEGKVEHTIVTTDFTGEFAIPGVIPRHAEVETWVGRDHVRQLYRDARTRTVMQECSETAAAMTCWRRDGGISVIPNERQPSFGWRSRASEAGSLRAGIERGWYAKTGERTVGGRLAHVYESTDEEVDEAPNSHSTYVVDAETGVWFSVVHEGGTPERRYRQASEWKLAELLDQRAVHSFRLRTPKAVKALKRYHARKAKQRRARRG